MRGGKYKMEALSVGEIVKATGGKLLCGSEDTLITSVSTNSKEILENSLFVPLIGERTDAHDFIAQAFANGGAAVFTSRHKKEKMESDNSVIKDKVYIGVEDTKDALQRLAAFYRSKFTIPVIGITGSVGKTTTKEMVAAALQTKLSVLKTSGNMNSQVGVALMMFRLGKEHEAAVIEMGMSEAGEMENLAKVAKPSIAVMTNIGVSHIAQLKTQENIRKEKLDIINEFKEDGILYVCGNDPLLNEIYNIKTTQSYDKIETSDTALKKLKNIDVIAYGTENSCGYTASNMKTVGEETHFMFHSPHKEPEEVILNVLGIHNVHNAVAALAIADYFGIPIENAKEGLRAYRPIAMRGQIYENKGIKVIDDTYNASPDSMKSGVNVLLELDNVKRRIAVLADVLELGAYSDACHYDVGKFISDKNIDLVITIGKEAKTIAKAVRENSKTMQSESFLTNETAIKYLKNVINQGDAVLVKGSRGMHTEEIVNALMA